MEKSQQKLLESLTYRRPTKIHPNSSLQLGDILIISTITDIGIVVDYGNNEWRILSLRNAGTPYKSAKLSDSKNRSAIQNNMKARHLITKKILEDHEFYLIGNTRTSRWFNEEVIFLHNIWSEICESIQKKNS